MKWIVYGKTSPDFFVKKLTTKKNQAISDWDNDFILQLSMIPKNIISLKTAQKILFIGKAIRILVKENEVLSDSIKCVTEEIQNLK